MGAEQQQTLEDLKREIVVPKADLSRLLRMLPKDDTIANDARVAFLSLLLHISRALNIELQ